MIERETPSYTHFCENVRTLMRSMGISQVELAARCQIARPNLNRLLSGRQFPRFDILDQIAQALNVSADRLIAEPKKISRRAS